MGRKKNKGSKPKAASATSGSMMGMRGGFKSAVGQGTKKKRREKDKVDFVDVLTIGFLLALLVVVIWQFAR